MRPTTDAALIKEKMQAAFGQDMGAAKSLSRPGTYALTNDAGFLVFERRGPGLYEVILGADPNARGKPAKDMINEAFAWLFINTDALVIRGRVRKDNLTLLALIPHTPGARPAVDKGNFWECKATFGLWAKGYGIDKALTDLRAAGQNEKAVKLEKAAGVSRGK